MKKIICFLLVQMSIVHSAFASVETEINTMQDIVEKGTLIVAQTMRDSCKHEQPLLSKRLDEAYKKGSIQIILASKDAEVNGLKLSQLPNYYQQIPEKLKQQFKNMISDISASVKPSDSLKTCTEFIKDFNQLDALKLKNESVEKYMKYKQQRSKE